MQGRVSFGSAPLRDRRTSTTCQACLPHVGDSSPRDSSAIDAHRDRAEDKVRGPRAEPSRVHHRAPGTMRQRVGSARLDSRSSRRAPLSSSTSFSIGALLQHTLPRLARISHLAPCLSTGSSRGAHISSPRAPRPRLVNPRLRTALVFLRAAISHPFTFFFGQHSN